MQCEITERAIKLLKLEGGRPSLVMDIGNQSKLRGRVRLMLGAALENFPARKRKKKFWFHVGNILRTKLSEQAEPHPIPPPTINHQNHTRPLHPKSTPAIFLSPHCWGKLAVLATQSQGDSTCACDCKARIVSLPLPAEKIISQSAQKHHDDCNSSAVISRSVPTQQVRFSPRPTRTPVCP